LTPEKRRGYRGFIDTNGCLPELLPRIEEAEAYWSARIKDLNQFPGIWEFGHQAPNGAVPWPLRRAYASVHRLGSAYAHATPRGVGDYIHSGEGDGHCLIRKTPDEIAAAIGGGT